MSTHLITDPAATASAVFPAAPGWLALSAAMTDEVPIIADRKDLVVTIAPGAGHGAPACFLPAQAQIEIDGTHLGTVDPATATPATYSDRDRYAPVWGLLTHECAHAHHTGWTPPAGTSPAVVQAAMVLEEPRIEAAHIMRRPDDRYWLRASSTQLILAETLADDPDNAPEMTVPAAAHAAALLLARVDGGILTKQETEPVRRAVLKVLGGKTLAKLRAVWRRALAVADDNGTRMVKLGQRWHDIVADATPITPPGSTPPDPTLLADAINKTVARITRAVTEETLPPDPSEIKKQQDADEQEERDRADETAEDIFDEDGPEPPSGETELAATRPPTAAERIAARVFARTVTTAAIPERVSITTPSATPPGRLRMSGALAADAQRAAGAIPTAKPFVRTRRVTLPSRRLALGIGCDVSGSMGDFAGPVASAAWIVAQANKYSPVDVMTATVIFGHHVRPITRPGVVPEHVTEFASRDNWEAADTAIDALDGALGLSLPGAARLLVMVSDGSFREEPLLAAQRRVNRLRARGCGVLWLAPDSAYSTPPDGVTVVTLTDPATTARAIGRAAVTALRAANR
jgi:hypothetical protein